MTKVKKGALLKRQDGSQIGFTQVSTEFIIHQVDLTGTSVKIYLYFIQQASLKKTLSLRINIKEIAYAVGIREEATVTKGIRGLVNRGWIRDIEISPDGSQTYLLAVEKNKPNQRLIDFLNEQSIKKSERSKLNLANSKIGRDDKGKFIKSDYLKNGENSNE